MWEEYDACCLIKRYPNMYDDILIDVGTSDSFYTGGQLLPEALQTAAGEVNQNITLRLQV